MVTGAASDVSTCTFSPSSTPEHSEGSEHGETPPIVAETEADGLAHMRETFSGQGSDNTLAEFICGSWRSSTKSQYASVDPGGVLERSNTMCMAKLVGMVWAILYTKNYANCKAVPEISLISPRGKTHGMV